MTSPAPQSEQNTNIAEGLHPPADAEATAGINRAARIAVLNDAFRRTFVGGHVVETSGVLALPEAERIALLLAVRRFDSFDGGNDPHGEHDFGAVETGGRRCFWKIDTYDRDLRGHSPDPADSAVTARVQTIMLAEEY